MPPFANLDAARLNATADKYGVKARYLAQNFDDYQRMVAEINPDAVYVIGQPNIMYPIWKWFLEQGRNLYIEKPLGLSLHQARSLAYLAEKHGCITQVSFQRRSCPMVVTVARRVPEARPDYPCRVRVLQTRARNRFWTPATT